MGKRPKRKIVLFLVEGKSDREALQLAIPELYDEIDEDIEVYFPIIRKEEEEKGGDITSTNYENKQGKHYWVHPSNIEEAIYELFLDDFFDKEKILPKDISEIIQIVDTDGAYIPDECVVLDSSLSEEDSPFYKDDKIACLDVDKIVKHYLDKADGKCNISVLDSTMEEVVMKSLQLFIDMWVDSRKIVDMQREKQAQRLKLAEKHLLDMEKSYDRINKDLRDASIA